MHRMVCRDPRCLSELQPISGCMSRWAAPLTQICTCYDRQISVHILVTQCVYVSAFSTVHVVGEWHAHTLSCIPCASVHTCFLFFFYNPYMCQCKRALRLTLTLFLLASSKLGLYIINHLCRLRFCVVSHTQYQTRPQLEVILWTISILIQRYTVHGPITCMCYGEPVYCMAVVYTSTCMV